MLMTSGLQGSRARSQYFEQAAVAINFLYESLWILMTSGFWSSRARFQYFDQATVVVSDTVGSMNIDDFRLLELQTQISVF